MAKKISVIPDKKVIPPLPRPKTKPRKKDKKDTVKVILANTEETKGKTNNKTGFQEGNQYAVGIGRPTKYKEEYNELSRKYCLLGATDQDLADNFDVDKATIENWKIEYPSFFDSIKEGKQKADANVADRLYNRALGYEHPEDQIFIYQGEPIIVPTTKHYPPDATSAIFWLKNRKPKEWRDKQELDLSNPDGSLNNLSNLPVEELEKRLALIKQIEDSANKK